jgi:hypothetical protein
VSRRFQQVECTSGVNLEIVKRPVFRQIVRRLSSTVHDQIGVATPHQAMNSDVVTNIDVMVLKVVAHR